MRKTIKPKLYTIVDGLAIPFVKSEKMRCAMCLVYPDSAMPDWMDRLYRWHIPAAISPLHDKDTWDDVRTPVIETNEKGEPIMDKNGEAVLKVDGEGEVVFHYFHHKGDIKKPHWHVMLSYGNATTEKVFQKIIDDIGGVIPELEHMQVSSPWSMFRYFGHLDDSDKTQYDMKDCVLMGGFDPANFETYTGKNEPVKEVLGDIKYHSDEIHSYKDLVYYYKKKGNDRLLYWVNNHTILLSKMFD